MGVQLWIIASVVAFTCFYQLSRGHEDDLFGKVPIAVCLISW